MNKLQIFQNSSFGEIRATQNNITCQLASINWIIVNKVDTKKLKK